MRTSDLLRELNKSTQETDRALLILFQFIVGIVRDLILWNHHINPRTQQTFPTFFCQNVSHLTTIS